MTDTLEIFGTEYTGVTGIKATDDNNNTKTYIRPQGTKPITANGSNIDVAEYAFANVSVDSNEFIVTITWDDDYFGQDDGAWIPDMTYAQIQSAYNAGKEIAVISGGEATADGGWNSDNSQFLYVVQSFGENPAYYFYILSANGIELDETYEYIVPRFQTITKTYTPTTSQQTESVTYSSPYNGVQEVDITVNAMPSGTAGTPSASKGTVSNHSISVTPSVTNVTGYITGSTKTGTAVTVSASELVSGSETKTQNGTYDVTNLASLIVNVSGGGGASNVVQGTFTTGSTRASSSGTVSLSYSGSGYPIAFFVYIDGGAYNDTSSGNTTWYNSLNRYDCGFFAMVKSRTTSAPTYTTSGEDNYGTVALIYKNSTSVATTYTRNSSMTASSYSSSSSASGVGCVRFKGNGKTLSYYTGNKTSSTVGLAPSTKYAYIVIYSS